MPCEERNFVMPFGKWSGESLEEIYINDRGYLDWCAENLENDDIREKIEAVLEDMDANVRIF